MATPLATGRSWLLATVLVLGAGTVLSACGSSTASKASVIKAACAQLSADLSDGPDPSVDPVGYAEAQMLPLSKIKVADKPLQRDILLLDFAYAQYFTHGGGAAAAAQVKQYLARVERFCPRVAS
jgi:hypothetical protein